MVQRTLMTVLVGLLLASCNDGTRTAGPAISPGLEDRVPVVLAYCPVSSDEEQPPSDAPLSAAPPRTLFQVRATITGPWRVNALGRYHGEEWSSEPVKEATLEPIGDLRGRDQATFVLHKRFSLSVPIAGSQVTGISGPVRFGLDDASGAVRPLGNLREGRVRYQVSYGRVPSIAELRDIRSPEEGLARYLEVPAPPTLVREELARLQALGPWDRLDELRRRFLEKVVAAGEGVKVPVSPKRVDEMLSGANASPFEIVAGQALLARWAGIPSRIAFGYDGGDAMRDGLAVGPQHGQVWLEVHFAGFGWLPIVGLPERAEDCG